MKYLYNALILNVALALASCSHIDEAGHLIYVKPPSAQRAVLLEDFTGQRCVNCPLGADIIEQLQKEFGDTVVIAVGIHGGPLGFSGNASNIGLATDVGDEYFKHWGLEYQPVGLVNRHGAIDYTDWARAVREELAKSAPLSITLEATITGAEMGVTVATQATDGTIDGRLQLWLLEDSISALQLMPDGSANFAYQHRHVFRTPINGTWGDPLHLTEGQTGEKTMTCAIADDWNVENLMVVAFVYNDTGVLQAASRRVVRE